MGIALRYNPAVKWYFIHKCPEFSSVTEEITANVHDNISSDEIRDAELKILGSVEDFVLYTHPKMMDDCSNYIYSWNKERLFELADFSGKIVLDVGSGSGRLAFSAAEKAKEVYAVEPVNSLREYLLEKVENNKIKNMRVASGFVECIPYPDNMFDIVMSGHVVGDDYEAEINELTRVVKSGGWILDCPGDEQYDRKPSEELRKRGFEELHYINSLGGDTYRYRKQIKK